MRRGIYSSLGRRVNNPPQVDNLPHILVGAVVGELHVDAEIGLRSSCITSCRVSRSLPETRTRSPWMDACTFFLLSLIVLHDLAGFLDRDALLQRDLLAHALARGGRDGAVIQPFERHLALDQLLLQNLDHGFELEFVRAGEQDLVVLFVELDGGVRVLQIVALLIIPSAPAEWRCTLRATRFWKRCRKCFQACEEFSVLMLSELFR